jgi:hypothetical protein
VVLVAAAGTFVVDGGICARSAARGVRKAGGFDSKATRRTAVLPTDRTSSGSFATLVAMHPA